MYKYFLQEGWSSFKVLTDSTIQFELIGLTYLKKFNICFLNQDRK